MNILLSGISQNHMLRWEREDALTRSLFESREILILTTELLRLEGHGTYHIAVQFSCNLCSARSLSLRLHHLRRFSARLGRTRLLGGLFLSFRDAKLVLMDIAHVPFTKMRRNCKTSDTWRTPCFRERRRCYGLWQSLPNVW